MQSASLHPLRNKVVVELGAGCGLPLLSAGNHTSQFFPLHLNLFGVCSCVLPPAHGALNGYSQANTGQCRIQRATQRPK